MFPGVFEIIRSEHTSSFVENTVSSNEEASMQFSRTILPFLRQLEQANLATAQYQNAINQSNPVSNLKRKSFARSCCKCGTTKTVAWRSKLLSSWTHTRNKGGEFLCNPCGLSWHVFLKLRNISFKEVKSPEVCSQIEQLWQEWTESDGKSPVRKR